MKKLVAFTFLVLYAGSTFACSTFLLSRNGQHFFGRNYDWVTGNGMVLVNARGVKKTSYTTGGEKPVTWVSDCGSITFNQYGKEFPHGGINEKGLVVELMWLSETVYPQADQRGTLNELQWIQYQLDNHTTVEQVIASDKLLRINHQDAVPLHYLVADAAGNAATIEFIGGKMVVHKGADLPAPVLTNTAYGEAIGRIKRGNGSSYGDNSLDRFATACRMVEGFQQAPANENPVDYSFSILDKVAQGDFTKWRIVYDITNREVHFITKGDRKRLSLKDFNFDCNNTSLYFDLGNPEGGQISRLFAPLSFEQNKTLLQRSAKESISHVKISEAAINRAAGYYRQVACK
ncbi:MAG: hypothetical protein JWP69_1324 [Flaviaesturariibacter sp.]|nr:hypothetical protein [Flaviaesturariibacter sp.]